MYDSEIFFENHRGSSQSDNNRLWLVLQNMHFCIREKDKMRPEDYKMTMRGSKVGADPGFWKGERGHGKLTLRLQRLNANVHSQ